MTEADRVLLHHLWSPDASHYLFRDMHTWYLYSWRTRQVVTVYHGESFPKHCYFDHSGEHIVLLDEDYTVRLLACNSLALIATASVKMNLRANEKIDFLVFDPFENQVLLGINVRFEGMARSKRWLAVKVQF